MASWYQLNQNNGLLKAQDIKAKENILKQQHKAEMVTIEGQLYMFAHRNVTAKKVHLYCVIVKPNPFIYKYQLQIAPLLKKVFTMDDADATLNMMLGYTSAKYIGLPVLKPNVLLSFGRFVTNI